ncbi:hypothetical protein T440DRAFT_513971 [Plenodomus tracheiphilus IPT5]|uniref:Aminoglycoside phosphotransferase domain-containing protein n=1 Tax=Plenodomus tracheiphilus IPT5 TaxID=1408161 RepID=A0A6A7BK52_9PLEO|nr:hypothetical protein T440DRAFT_513971 [Plenodomus tracheiphilus IPT5]
MAAKRNNNSPEFVHRFGSAFVKTCFSWTLMQEAEDLLYIEKHSQVRAPILYAAFSRDIAEGDPDTRRYHIVMEYIEGEELSPELWRDLTMESRKTICSKLAEQLRLLRATPAPAYYGRVHNQGFNPCLNLFLNRFRGTSGPYSSYSDFCKANMVSTSIRLARRTIPLEDQPEKLQVLCDYESQVKSWGYSQPTLTHIDPRFSNIIVRRVQSNQGEDWEAVTMDQALNICGFVDGVWEDYDKEEEEFIKMVSDGYWEESYDEQVATFAKIGEELGIWVY